MGRRGKGLIWGFDRGADGTGRDAGSDIGFDFELFSLESYLGI